MPLYFPGKKYTNTLLIEIYIVIWGEIANFFSFLIFKKNLWGKKIY